MKTIEIIKEVAGMKIGIKKTVPTKTANNLINRGLAKEVATTKESKIVTKSKEDEGSTKKPRAKRSKPSNGKTSKK